MQGEHKDYRQVVPGLGFKPMTLVMLGSSANHLENVLPHRLETVFFFYVQILKMYLNSFIHLKYECTLPLPRRVKAAIAKMIRTLTVLLSSSLWVPAQ